MAPCGPSVAANSKSLAQFTPSVWLFLQRPQPQDFSCGIATQDDNIAVPPRPFALDPDQPRANLENHVVTATLHHWSVDVDPEFDRRVYDRRLRDRTFLITGEHLSNVATQSAGPWPFGTSGGDPRESAFWSACRCAPRSLHLRFSCCVLSSSRRTARRPRARTTLTSRARRGYSTPR